MSDLQDKGDVKVVARIRNNGFVVSYTDTKNPLGDKDTYYYTAMCALQREQRGPN